MNTPCRPRVRPVAGELNPPQPAPRPDPLHSLSPARIGLRRRRILSCLLCVLGLSLAACGQRGPLYLPDESGPSAAGEAAPAADQGAATGEEDDDEETS
jgi:predicted small lipoprotein YifL